MPVGCASKMFKEGRELGEPAAMVLEATAYCLSKFKELVMFCPKVEIHTTLKGLPGLVKSKQLGLKL